MATKSPPTTKSLALTLAVLDPIVSTLNTALVLFPHAAILALMGASGAWWGALALLVVTLYGLRRERSRVTEQLLSRVMSPAPTQSTQSERQEGQP